MHMFRGSAWAILMRWCIRLIGLVSTIILSRVLHPADFGLLAMGTLMIGLLTALSRFGEGQLLMRERNVTREHCDTAWTIRLVKSLVIGVILASAAPLAVRYFREPRALQVFYVLGTVVAISGLQNIGMVLVTRELDFARDFRFNVYSKLVRFSTTVPLAFVLRNYWALLLGYLINAILDVVMTYWMHAYRPRLSLAKLKEYLRFSVSMIPLNFGAFLAGKIDTFVVGRIGETSQLGSYNVAAELSVMATDELGMQVSRALFPSYAKLLEQPRELAEAFVHSLGAMAVISFALGVGLAAVAKEFVLAVLGTKWEMAIPFLQWLAICGAIRSVSQILSGSILIVTGHERMSAMLIWFRLALAAPAALIAGHWWGIAGVPIAVTVASALVLPFAVFAVTRAIPVTYRDIVRALWRPLLAAVVMTLAVRTYSAVTSSALLDLSVRVGLGALVFLSTLLILWVVTGKGAGPERAMISLVEKRFTRT